MTRRFVFALAFIAFVVVPFRAQAAQAPAALTPMTARIVELVNTERAQAGLPALRANSVLIAEAVRFSAVQADLETLSHRGNDDTNAGQRLTKAGYRWDVYGENLAGGQQTAEEVVADWMASPTHRPIVLNTKVREIGVGHTHRAGDPRGIVDYYVLEVARPR